MENREWRTEFQERIRNVMFSSCCHTSESLVRHSSFIIRCSLFIIRHSSFVIPLCLFASVASAAPASSPAARKQPKAGRAPDGGVPARNASAPPNTPSRQDPPRKEWIVLPDKIQPYEIPSLEGARGAKPLCYPQAVVEKRRCFSDPGEGERIEWLEFPHEGGVAFLPLACVARKIPLPPDAENLPIGREVVNRDTPLPLDYAPSDLVPIAAKWLYAKDVPVRMRREAAQMVERMFRDAETLDKIRLRAVSGFRSAETQRGPYLKKIEAAGMDQNVVAKPGHSEHQLGTTLDVNGLDPATLLETPFENTPEGRWVRDNAAKYGFRLSYTRENARRTGYIPEPWHLRYIGKGLASQPDAE
jgi:LAS superfamily LD-carboxypeptidase LdcB